jgi:hypothetical protein
MSAMYLQNKYTIRYKIIIAQAQSRISTDGYTENHHIIPKSLGGTNDKENLVKLTGREHFICHLLLTKMTIGKNRGKMIFALNSMMNRKNENMDRYVPSSRMYESLRKQLSEAHKQLGRSDKHKAAISTAHTGKIVSDETRNRMRESAKKNIVGAAVKGSKRSDNTKQKISQSRKGIVFSEEHRKKLSEAAKNRMKK